MLTIQPSSPSTNTEPSSDFIDHGSLLICSSRCHHRCSSSQSKTPPSFNYPAMRTLNQVELSPHATCAVDAATKARASSPCSLTASPCSPPTTSSAQALLRAQPASHLSHSPPASISASAITLPRPVQPPHRHDLLAQLRLQPPHLQSSVLPL